MFEFFTWVADIFEVIFGIISNFFGSLIALLEVVWSFMTLPGTLTGMLPPIIYVSFSIVFSIAIIKLILGWGNQ